MAARRSILIDRLGFSVALLIDSLTLIRVLACYHERIADQGVGHKQWESILLQYVSRAGHRADVGIPRLWIGWKIVVFVTDSAGRWSAGSVY